MSKKLEKKRKKLNEVMEGKSKHEKQCYIAGKKRNFSIGMDGV